MSLPALSFVEGPMIVCSSHPESAMYDGVWSKKGRWCSVSTMAVLCTVTEPKIAFYFWCERPCMLMLRQLKVEVFEEEWSVFVCFVLC